MEVKKMSKPIEADFLTFIEKLKEAYQSDTSCCVIFTTKDGKVGRVFIKKGKIIFLSFNDTRGIDAIPLIRQLDKLSFRVARFMPVLEDKKLPDTPNILRELLGQETVESTSSETIPNARAGLNDEQQKIIGDILNDIAGPMSEFFVKDYVINASSLAEVVSNLSEELSSEDIMIFESELEKRF